MNAVIGVSPFVLEEQTLSVHTQRRLEFVDITEQVVGHLRAHQVAQGQVLVFCRHTTAAIIINEHEPLLLNDLARTLDRLAGPQAAYDHDDLSRRTANLVENEPANGHAHCQQLALGCSVTVPVIRGELALGRWQRIFLVELDSARLREVLLQLWGR